MYKKKLYETKSLLGPRKMNTQHNNHLQFLIFNLLVLYKTFETL